MNASPADWYPDPLGRHEFRYYDGEAWTEHVASHGRQSVDPPVGMPNMPTVGRGEDKIAGDLGRAGVSSGETAPGTSLLDQPVLVVNQKVKLIELNNEYAVFDRSGVQVGAVRQVGQSALKKAARLLGGYDQFFTHKLQIVDASGAVVLGLTRPAKFVKSRVVVSDGLGAEIGQIVQRNVFGKIRFGFDTSAGEVGSINAEDWRAWNFSITDASGTEVARITKTWEGLAKTMFTTADNYVVQVHAPLAEPLRSMVVASALAVDTALKQDSRGLS
ncbi:phospholipid scramblase-related protein [soil metagenome]